MLSACQAAGQLTVLLVSVCAVSSEGSEQQEEQHPEPHQGLRLPEQHQD